jgi:hypothetical protein
MICGINSTKSRSTHHSDAAEMRRILTSTRWTYSRDFEEVKDRLAKVTIGKMPEGMLVDVAVCEHHSGTVLVSARIDHHCSNSELHTSKDSHKLESLQPHLRTISQMSSRNVYSIDGSKCTGLLDVHAVASRFRASGITTQTYFLSWHVNKRDLTLLRQFFEEAGYDDILPPSNSHCVQMIPSLGRMYPRRSAWISMFFPIVIWQS